MLVKLALVNLLFAAIAQSILIDNFRPVHPFNGRKISWKGKNLNDIQEAEDYVHLSSEEIESPEWSYSGNRGLAFWPKAYPVCGRSHSHQSPINLPSLQSSSNGVPLEFGFHKKLFAAYLEKGEHNVDLRFKDENCSTVPTICGGYLKDTFQFHRLHFHWGSKNFKGSEHRVDGYAYPGEAHFVHFNKKYGSMKEAADKPDGLLVLGFFLKLSKMSSPGMQLVTRGMKDIEKSETDQPLYIGDLSIESILGFKPDPAKYVFYRGSITIPPCTENVFWHILTEPIRVTETDLNALRHLTNRHGKSLSDNNRPVQPRKGREVILNGVSLK